MTDSLLNDTNQPLSVEAQIEALQMTSEANSAAMIMFNARLAMLAEAVGVDISEPPLTDVEEKNKDMLLKSVARRMARLMQTASELMGEAEKLSGEEIADVLQGVVDEVWPAGSISGDTRPVPDPMPVVDPVDTPIPTTPMPTDSAPIFTSQHPDAVLKRQMMEAEAPLFTPPSDGGFTVEVLSLDAFSGIDMTVPENRKEIWDSIVEKYCADADAAVAQNWINAAWADRVKQEFRLSPDNPEITSSLTLPPPGDVANGVAQTAAAGDTMITITGITDQTEVVEALVTAFMTSTARMNIAISMALMPDRLAQMGMAPNK